MIAPKTREARLPSVALCPLGGGVPSELAPILLRRGVASAIATLADARRKDVGAIAAVARSRLTKNMVAELAPLCVEAARASRPVVLLASATYFASTLERVQISAFLESAGAIVLADPDNWLETVVLIAAFGLPRGPRTALVFPRGSWLDDAAEALARQRFGSRLRATTAASASDLSPTDIVLCDPSELPTRAVASELVVCPLRARGELVADGSPPILVGLRAALIAAEVAGELRLRIDQGLGEAADRDSPADMSGERIERQLAKLGERAGDHETKVLLAAAGAAITRQAVATTASAATRLAKRAGYPVEMKPWGPSALDEKSGCPLETSLETAADVRRAFAALAGDEGAAIVRETPPSGRELSAEISIDKTLGPMMVVQVAGQREPLAAVSPLSPYDADRLSRGVAATRIDDPEPALAEVAELLRRASFLHRDVATMKTLALPRIIAGERVAVVVDAWATFGD